MWPDPMMVMETLGDLYGWLLVGWLAISLAVIAVVDGGSE